MRILAVEDEALSALLLSEAFDARGWSLAVVREGEKALMALTQLDIECDGLILSSGSDSQRLEWCQRLRLSGCANANIPLLYVLREDTPERRNDARRFGVTALLKYPLEPDEVFATLERCREGVSWIEPEPAPVLALSIPTAAAPEAVRISVPKTSLEPLPALAPLPLDDELALVPIPEHPNTGFGPRQKLGEILIRSRIITEGQLEEALDIQLVTREKLGTILVGKGWATEGQVSAAYSHQVDVPFVEVDKQPIAEEIVLRIPREQALRHLFLPLASDDEDIGLGAPRIRVALADPFNIVAIDLVQQQTRTRVKAVLAEPEALRRTIEQVYLKHQRPDDEIVQALSVSLEGAQAEQVFEDEDADASDDGPIARFVNQIIVEGVRRRASDIHIEPYKKDFDVRYRVDGQLIVAHTLPRQSYGALVSRIKVMGDMDIAEKRIPQDGRVALVVDERPIQFRLSTLPNQFGERIVMRILDKGATQKTLDQLDFSAVNTKHYQTLIARPHGIILVTGPTGSGKTTTLYASLNAVRSPTLNIMTCEDPIEYEMDRISQSMVNPKAGLTFAAQLRAILRQDPDVVLVGEIRDGETAEIAFKAAMTGHLVLSTLHCNEAAGAAARLTDMGVEPFLIASGMIGAVAQRLVRRLCPHCRVIDAPSSEEKRLLELLHGGPVDVPAIGKKVGCSKCNQMGTLGRIGIHEVMLMNEQIQSLIIERAPTARIQEVAKESAGFVPMVEDGIAKVVSGIALLEDVVKKVVNQ